MPAPTEVPEAWKKPAPPEPLELVNIPERGSDDYAELAAWYSGWSYMEMYRKVLQANCRESIRAQRTLNNEKLTEARLDDLARLHPAYLEYLEQHLRGRVLWEREFLAQGGMAR